ncbi:OsmC family protein [Roseibacillus persicicus]|nr:OsmC family protein [Roseibacillus persicicus]MDQ8190711.1 OsmC family protein [Roseibacillus persicicus]
MSSKSKTMVEVSIDYKGDLHCEASHGPSGARVETDAPVDNQGRGESFSPTDLIATALGTCMATIMGITADRKELSLEGLRIQVQKEMSSDLPRRIVRLPVTISVPLAGSHPSRKVLEAAALSCPVMQSIHPDIEVPVTWTWL